MAIRGLPFKYIPPSNHGFWTANHGWCPVCYSNNYDFDKDLNVTCECGWFGSRFDMLICTEQEYIDKYLKKYLRRKKLERIFNI